MTENRCFMLMKHLFIIIIFLLSLFLAYSYVSSGYSSFIRALLLGVGRMNVYDGWLASAAILLVYKVLKVVVVVLFVLIVAGLYDSWFANKTRFSKVLNKWMSRLSSVVWGNILYIRQLDIPVKTCLVVILFVHLLFLTMFIFIIPFHYDEAWSYVFFSGKGFLQTTTFYPLPNNHIFYNLVSGLFAQLPISPEISTRLPSVISSVIAVYYLFKLATGCFSKGIALFITVLFAACFPVLLYSVGARGYSFLTCFTVLIFYAVNGLIQQPGRKKFRYLYFFSMAAGLYTMPSFLYLIFPVNATLFLYYILNKQWRQTRFFIADNFKAAALTALSYAPVVYFNSIDLLIQPNGSVRQPLNGIMGVLWSHLSSAWTQMTGYWSIPLYIAVLLIALTLLGPFLKKEKISIVGWLTIATLVSPPVILLLHRVVPFERTWFYLAVPLVISIGFLASLVVYYIRKINKGKIIIPRLVPYHAAVMTSLLLGLFIILYANFIYQHRRHFQIDYNIRDTFGKLGHEIEHIESIGYSSASMEFYAAEDLYFECYKRNPAKPVILNRNEINYTEDVLVLSPASLDTSRLSNYQFIGGFENQYSLFLHKK
jgi:hypothetical protein